MLSSRIDIDGTNRLNRGLCLQPSQAANSPGFLRGEVEEVRRKSDRGKVRNGRRARIRKNGRKKGKEDVVG